MNSLRRFLCVVPLFLVLASSAVAKGGVKISEDKDRLRVEIDGKLFTEYFFADVPRPFCYPLIGPGDLPMTRDYPMQSPPGEEHDHIHHRSFWYAHGDVNGHDFWAETKTNPIVHQKFLAVKSGKKSGVIHSQNKWITGAGKWICSDERKLTFHSDTNPKIIDFEIKLMASNGDVVFGDTKEGSLAIRVAESMRVAPGTDKKAPRGHIVQSTGLTDTNTWGKAAEWCDYNGLVQGKQVGIAILDHPKNPRHPTWWHVRDYGLFAANPFGVHHFQNKPAGTGDLKIAAGKSVTFRYRVVLHEGDEKESGIAKLYEAYSKQKF
ncbi:MAG: Transrane protein [Verrucomicrobiales bacterium]|nr:Transrane protein [Verrucomicrobiales bacterium]